MEINNPQTFDNIKEINGEIIRPKLVIPLAFEPINFQADGIVWRDEEAGEYHVPPALVDMNGIAMRPAIVTIGNWNMPVSNNHAILHGMADYTKIFPINVMIRPDSDSNGEIVPLNRGLSATDSTPQGYLSSIEETVIRLTMLNGGFFSTEDFDEPDYNRGWIIFWYWG
ncbi:unnamed protein product [marine sediment metagenome]|uniref:Uncharacterized protein n=1 Tax=marine sediment metagenome TaxID=412755 RepID=X1NIC4_9ZZZZ